MFSFVWSIEDLIRTPAQVTNSAAPVRQSDKQTNTRSRAFGYLSRGSCYIFYRTNTRSRAIGHLAGVSVIFSIEQTNTRCRAIGHLSRGSCYIFYRTDKRTHGAAL